MNFLNSVRANALLPGASVLVVELDGTDGRRSIQEDIKNLRMAGAFGV